MSLREAQAPNVLCPGFKNPRDGEKNLRVAGMGIVRDIWGIDPGWAFLQTVKIEPKKKDLWESGGSFWTKR